MCIQSCKSCPFLNPTTPTPLNPDAHEWKPHHLPPPPPPPPPQTAALLVPIAAHPPHNQKLMWHLPLSNYYYHPMPCIRRPCPLIVYHPPPFSSPPPPPPPHFDAGELKVNGLEHCVNYKLKMMRPIVKERSKVVKPLVRWEWKVKKTVADGGAAASSPPTLPASYSSRTTVMVRNIPNQLRRDYMLEFLDSYCDEHSLKYDFMYLPMDFRSKDNLGYAFVNFTSGGDALKLKKILNNYKWGTIKTDEGKLFTSKKICAITWARIQGKDKLMERFEDSMFACDDLNFLPVVFDPPRGGGPNTTTPAIVGRLAC